MIDNLPGVSTATLPPPAAAATNATDPLNEQDFMQLMTQELQDQDPTNPTDPTQFIGQLAQFSQVDATETMQQSVSQLAASLATSQAMNAASLIGKQVMAPSSTLTLGSSGGVSGAVDVPTTATDVKVAITDAAGNPVQVLDLGPQPAGTTSFTWNGTNAAGAQVAAGTYGVAATNGAQALTTYAGGTVTSVGASSSGASVNVAGLGSVPLNQISQIF
ncbi:MAG TPA: FlgD immunoglobulin-like domain containing protein [Rhodanobacteraceae bacterium]|nr:FlgD immunoglobulin-like domain containing protein [Rhodanobacteraceae bacterium]